MPQHAIEVGIGEIDYAVAHRIRRFLAQDLVFYSTHGAVRVQSNEVQRFAKVDRQMTWENGDILERAINFDLQPRGGDIEDRYKAIVCVGPQPLIWITGVIVDEIQKCCARTR